MNNLTCSSSASHNKGRKYFVCIEGQKYRWPDSTITTEEIIELGGWDPAQGVIEIDKDNNERTLQPGEVIEIKPGQGFSKKICWKRGLTSFEERIDQELALLRNLYPDMVYVADGHWVLVPAYTTGAQWLPNQTDIAFQIPNAGYPGTPPYGIYVPVGIRFQGKSPGNYKEPAPVQPPFGGNWGIFSWTTDASQWRPSANISAGTNLLNWVQGFVARFQEGI